jgi:DNA-binding transcriptional LysR family regulator
MSIPDFNMLVTLNALLSEGSVARAARRLNLSPSAMSRALARLREVTGDPLLVRAGRNLVPTPRAMELRNRVGTLVNEAESVLSPARELDLKQIVRTFTIRVSDGFVENFGPTLIARLEQDAPGITLRFLQKLNKDSVQLREGNVDLETGVVGESTSPEVRLRALFRDRFIGVVRKEHPLSQGDVTVERYVAAKHIAVSRRGVEGGPIEEALQAINQQRKIATIVSGFSPAIALARASDMVASVPEHHTGCLRDDMVSFTIPAPVPEFTVSLLWHPRMDADQVHRWLRGCIYDVCKLPEALNGKRREASSYPARLA